MEEEISVINNTRRTLKATLIEEIEYSTKRVHAVSFKVFDKDIPITKRKFRIIIEEEQEEAHH